MLLRAASNGDGHMRTVLFALLLSTTLAQAESKKANVSLKLAPGGRFNEVELSSTWFANAAVQGPVGGPTRGYDLAFHLWPDGPTLVVAAAVGKDELTRQPLYAGLEKPKLVLRAEADGHAVAWSVDDGKTWYALWVEAELPFFCTHATTSPGAIRGTAIHAREVLSTAAHPPLVFGSPNRGELNPDPSQELRGALTHLLREASDDASVEVALTWLTAAQHRKAIEEAGLLREAFAPRLAAYFRDHAGRRQALDALATPTNRAFFAELDAPPRASTPGPSTPAPVACRGGTLPAKPIPSELTARGIWERLVVPTTPTEDTCRAGKAFAAWLARQPGLSTLRGAPSVAKHEVEQGQTRHLLKNLRMTCVPSVTAIVAGHHPSSYSSLSSTTQSEFEDAVMRCSGGRDQPCVRALRDRTQRDFAAAALRERQAWCGSWETMVDRARSCLELLDGQPNDATNANDRAQLWILVSAIAQMSAEVTCPPPPLKLLDPASGELR